MYRVLEKTFVILKSNLLWSEGKRFVPDGECNVWHV